MQWGQIKSILILSFFILNVYLFAQFLEKKEQSDLGVLEQDLYTIEEQLEDDSIEIGDLPEETLEETFISVEPYKFTSQDIKQNKTKTKQESYIINHSVIVSELENPLKVDVSSTNRIMKAFQDTVYFAQDYQYWNLDETYNMLMFFQNKLDRPIYFNQNGLVLAILNEEDEIEAYIQTRLGDEESLDDKRQLIEPLTAIEKVYEKGELNPEDEIDRVNIGFHTRVPFESGVQVFAPTWKVSVNDKRNYFVNAMEGFMFSTDEKEFIDEVLSKTIDTMETFLKEQDTKDEDKEKVIEKMINNLEQRLDNGVNE